MRSLSSQSSSETKKEENSRDDRVPLLATDGRDLSTIGQNSTLLPCELGKGRSCVKCKVTTFLYVPLFLSCSCCTPPTTTTTQYADMYDVSYDYYLPSPSPESIENSMKANRENENS